MQGKEQGMFTSEKTLSVSILTRVEHVVIRVRQLHRSLLSNR